MAKTEVASANSARVAKRSSKKKSKQKSKRQSLATNPSSTNDAVPGDERLVHLNDLVSPHVASFDYMVEQGLRTAVGELVAQEVRCGSGPGETLRMWFEDVEIGYPMKTKTSDDLDARLFPSECRERGLNYSAPLNASICTSVGEGVVKRVKRCLGQVPVMARSVRCHLAKASPKEMIRRHEDATELGGYFICNGM
jgi:DNA-directed RNA polymerase I subunit RPA2